ncbi:hypothetical protein A6D6_03537 [Alcanivorax xiamenensis]|uniref:RES domain-containing protein n=1 Tax=Alcanivorax xiamenensis TaxID=1177156 RepID=A0ABQ6Y4D5_9GAMM|nr:RES family NAD+ phosphorylase [Alcanivorax xiamenensis]KAF0803955.1 hypothetical protein A6D6_03537 [Alcanivorax xiamenensis]
MNQADYRELPLRAFDHQEAYRLVNGKYPPIDLFDDVADESDFSALFAVQALTNPRLQTQIGELNRVPPERRPWGIPGCSYALAPFVHVNPAGSRFSDGGFGVLYCAERMATAIAETRYHQQRYFQQVVGLKYDRVVMRGLRVRFSAGLRDIHNPLRDDDHWYHPEDYSGARRLGQRLFEADEHGLAYSSVRDPGALCFALLSPHLVESVIPSTHYEYIWDGERIAHVLTIRRVTG